jgi:hypothetical protein
MSDLAKSVREKNRRIPLTESELKFVETWVDCGANHDKVAKALDMKPAKVRETLTDYRIRDAIDLSRDLRIRTVGATKAWSAIDSIMMDPEVPPQVRLKAAQWTLEASGHGLAATTATLKLGLAGIRKDFHQMTEAELIDFVEKGRATVERVEAADSALKIKASTVDIKPLQDT